MWSMSRLEAEGGGIRRCFSACLAIGVLFYGANASAASPVPVIDTVAGGGTPAGNGDGGPATQARLDNPLDVAIDALGNLYVAELSAFRVRKITPAGVISTVAGNGSQAYNGDGIPATAAAIDTRSVAVDSAGSLYIADSANGRIRKVSPDGMIHTVASSLPFPTQVAVDPQGMVYAVSGNQVLKLGADGIPRAFAGSGEYGFSGDGGPASAAALAGPRGISFDGEGNLYIADHGNGCIRRVTRDGVISTVAGGGHFRSDPVAKSIYLLHPNDVAVDARGNIYISEMNNLIRVVSDHGFIKTAVGRFNDSTFGNEGAPAGFAGDGGPALDALINEPMGLALDSRENLYLVDNRNNRVRRVTTVPTPPDVAGADAFGPHVAYHVGSYTNNVGIADVNGDGRDDALLTTSSWTGDYVEPDNDFKLWVFLQTADGALAAPLKYPLFADANGRGGNGIAAADLNHDGFDDVVVASLTGIKIFRGTLFGLAGGAEYAGVDNAEVVDSLTILDVNRDGNPDVVTFGGGRSEGGTSWEDRFGLTVFYGNGAGGISSRRFHPRSDEYGWKFLRSSDIDGDGVLDLTSTWTELPNTAIFRGGFEVTYHNGTDGFWPPTRFATGQSGTWGDSYAVGDFDSDGRKDAVVSLSENAPDAAYAYLKQMADGEFVPARQWKAYDVPNEMLGADMNGDGLDDLVVLHGGWDALGYQQQISSGLEAEVKYFIEESANEIFPALAIGDLNHDRCKDVAIADRNQGLIVLPGKNCIVAPRPMNGSQPLVPPSRNAFHVDKRPSHSVLPGLAGDDPIARGDKAGFHGVEGVHHEPSSFAVFFGWLRRLQSPWLLLLAPFGVLLGTGYAIRVRRI